MKLPPLCSKDENINLMEGDSSVTHPPGDGAYREPAEREPQRVP